MAEPTLPNLIIIGAMKSGTSSLHYYLGLHPEIAMSREKELDFFIAEANWSRGIDWYASHFRRPARVRGEASPNYTGYPRFPDVPARMHEVVPDARLIYILRHPIERLVSHWVHRYAAGREDRPIEEALRDPRRSYVPRSRYAMQLSLYLEHFPASRILVLTQERLLREQEATLREVFRFLGVDETFRSRHFARRIHESRRKRRPNRLGSLLRRVPDATGMRALSPGLASDLAWVLSFPFSRPVPRPELSPALRNELTALLSEDVRELRRLTGQRFDEWGLE